VYEANKKRCIHQSSCLTVCLLVFFCPLSPCTPTLTSSLFSTTISLFCFLISSAFSIVFLLFHLIFSPISHLSLIPFLTSCTSVPSLHSSFSCSSHSLHLPVFIAVFFLSFFPSSSSSSYPLFPSLLSLLSVTTTTGVIAEGSNVRSIILLQFIRFVVGYRFIPNGHRFKVTRTSIDSAER